MDPALESVGTPRHRRSRGAPAERLVHLLVSLQQQVDALLRSEHRGNRHHQGPVIQTDLRPNVAGGARRTRDVGIGDDNDLAGARLLRGTPSAGRRRWRRPRTGSPAARSRCRRARPAAGCPHRTLCSWATSVGTRHRLPISMPQILDPNLWLCRMSNRRPRRMRIETAEAINVPLGAPPSVTCLTPASASDLEATSSEPRVVQTQGSNRSCGR